MFVLAILMCVVIDMLLKFCLIFCCQRRDFSSTSFHFFFLVCGCGVMSVKQSLIIEILSNLSFLEICFFSPYLFMRIFCSGTRFDSIYPCEIRCRKHY